MVLLEGIELSTSPLPRGCSTTELQQRQTGDWPGLLAVLKVRGKASKSQRTQKGTQGAPPNSTQRRPFVRWMASLLPAAVTAR